MGGGDVEGLLKAWSAAFSEEVLEFAQPPEVNDIEVPYLHGHTDADPDPSSLQIVLFNYEYQFDVFFSSLGSILHISTHPED